MLLGRHACTYENLPKGPKKNAKPLKTRTVTSVGPQGFGPAWMAAVRGEAMLLARTSPTASAKSAARRQRW